MSDPQLNNLIKMIDQIIANNLHQGSEDRVTDVAADHLHKFWARSMKQQIIACAHESPADLSALAQLTIAKLEAVPE
ncbi:formate dehydrogenase subunit delta [Marinobacter sp.]|uniref:formate dehydrogenase subunit delta n=1 Tax=Marinobacter sp. TaxID=50741 RepID=UPI003F966B9E